MQKEQVAIDWSCADCTAAPASPPVIADVSATPAATSFIGMPPLMAVIADRITEMEIGRIPDTSFTVTEPIVRLPLIDDVEISDRPPSSEIIPDGPVTYSVVTGANRKGGRVLVGSDGFTYSVKVRFVKNNFIFKNEICL